MKKIILLLAFVTSLMGAISANAEEITILRDDFDEDVLSPSDWTITISPGSAFFELKNSKLILHTTPDIGVGTAVVRSNKSFSVLNGALIFKSRIVDTYVDHAIYGDAQPRGLVAGEDRNNAIEFISALPVPNTVECRTVANGAVTSTIVDLGQSVRVPNVYQIVAKPNIVKFYINGRRVATHTTNIPTVPLNVYFSTGDSGAGNVPVEIDYVSFERNN